MSGDQWAILLIIAAAVGLFLSGRLRHDTVAIAALLAGVVVGVVPASEAFSGFGHPAVITVACVLILSAALQSTGAVNALTRSVLPRHAGPTLTIAAITGLAALLSGFMNNVGALALLLPVAVQLADRLDMPAGRILMPMSFGSILGGMTTLIGTPPNLIVAGFREAASGTGFQMFDFSPVGVPVALAGLALIVLGGWRLVPVRMREGAESFETGAYLTEVVVTEGSRSAGKLLRDIEAALVEADAQIIGLVRNENRIPAPSPFREVHAGDVMLIEADPKALSEILSSLELRLEANVRAEKAEEKQQAREKAAKEAKDRNGAAASEKSAANSKNTTVSDGDSEAAKATALKSKDIVLMELVVRSRAEIAGRSATSVRLRSRFGINLLAVSRQGQRAATRLNTMPIQEGDVLLVQGAPDIIIDFANRYGCVPLAERALTIPNSAKAVWATAIMAASIAGAAFGVVPAPVAFAAGVLALVLFDIVPARSIYDAVDWPIIVLLAALIPVASAMATTGAAELLAQSIVGGATGGNVAISLAVILILTMSLSDFMNNAATAAVMSPIAVGTAAQLGVQSDPFLMAVAIGASCAFLTPIGHQNNTLILGPGGFGFGDYWRLGILLEIVVVIVAVPLLLIFWPA